MAEYSGSEEVILTLHKNETLEDLQRCGMRLIQPDYGFRFCEDSVLLAAAAVSACPPGSGRLHVAELGAGSGAVAVLMAARQKRLDIRAIELDDHRFDCLKRNIILNNLEKKIFAYNNDIKIINTRNGKNKWPDGLNAADFDLVVMNPPYRIPSMASLDKWHSGTQTERSSLMAGEEIAVSLDQMLSAAALLLRSGGRFVMVHRPQRLPDIIEGMRNAGIEPVSLQVLESLPAKSPSRLIIIGRKNIKSGGFRWLKPLTVYNSPGKMSVEAAEIYGREPSMSGQQLMSGIERSNLNWTIKQ